MPHNTKLVAIINLTPDSFSDGGQYETPDAALAAIKRAVDEGADVIDMGAESTRPGAVPLNAAEEWQRLEPVLKSLPRVQGVEFSLDTYHPENATRALDLGVSWINDVSGFSNPDMVEAVKDSNCKLVVMHSLSVPVDKHVVMPGNANVVAQLLVFAKKRYAELEQASIARDRLIFDPGIGFGKTAAQSREILDNIEVFRELNAPLFVGHSRKSFLGVEGNEKRDLATLVISHRLAARSVDYLRVHNVAMHRAMLKGLASHVA